MSSVNVVQRVCLIYLESKFTTTYLLSLYINQYIWYWSCTENLSILFKIEKYYNNIYINLLKPTGHMMHQQFNIQELHVLPLLYLCVLYLSENKQRLVPLTALTDWFL